MTDFVRRTRLASQYAQLREQQRSRKNSRYSHAKRELRPSMRCSLPRRLSPLAATVVCLSSSMCAIDARSPNAIMDAGALTDVFVSATYFDDRDSSDWGCDPDGCKASLTRDGDSTTLQSRWSCMPALGSSGSTCSIVYTLGEALNLHALEVALYKGDTRTRTFEVYVNNDLVAVWTSSGTTTDFETIDISDEFGESIELRGVIDDTEWISIAEVEILVDFNGVVEAGTLGEIETSATFYDTRSSETNGCDPDGCVPSFTRDGDLAGGSRWSCAPFIGDSDDADCIISYDMGSVRELTAVRLALWKGTQRLRVVQILVDGNVASTWISSGDTNGFERIDLTGISGQVVEVVGIMSSSSDWISITETEILVKLDGSTPRPVIATSAPVGQPSATPGPTTPSLDTHIPANPTPGPVTSTSSVIGPTPTPATPGPGTPSPDLSSPADQTMVPINPTSSPTVPTPTPVIESSAPIVPISPAPVRATASPDKPTSTNPTRMPVDATSAPVDSSPSTPEPVIARTYAPDTTGPTTVPTEATFVPVEPIQTTVEPTPTTIDLTPGVPEAGTPSPDRSGPADENTATSSPMGPTPSAQAPGISSTDTRAPADESSVQDDATSSFTDSTPATTDPTTAPVNQTPATPEPATTRSDTPATADPTTVPIDPTSSPTDPSSWSVIQTSTPTVLDSEAPRHITASPDTPAPVDSTPSTPGLGIGNPHTRATAYPTTVSVDATSAPDNQIPATPKPAFPTHFTSAPAAVNPTPVDATSSPVDQTRMTPETGTPSPYMPASIDPTAVPDTNVSIPVHQTPIPDTPGPTDPILAPEHLTYAPVKPTPTTIDVSPAPTSLAPAIPQPNIPSPDTSASDSPSAVSIDVTSTPSYLTPGTPESSTSSPFVPVPAEPTTFPVEATSSPADSTPAPIRTTLQTRAPDLIVAPSPTPAPAGKTPPGTPEPGIPNRTATPTNPSPVSIDATSTPENQVPAIPGPRTPSPETPETSDPTTVPAKPTSSPTDPSLTPFMATSTPTVLVSTTPARATPSPDKPARVEPTISTPVPGIGRPRTATTGPTAVLFEATSTPDNQTPATSKPATLTPFTRAPAGVSPVPVDATSSPVDQTRTVPETGVPSLSTPSSVNSTTVPDGGTPSPVNQTPTPYTPEPTGPNISLDHVTASPFDSTRTTPGIETISPSMPEPISSTPAPIDATSAPGDQTPITVDTTLTPVDHTPTTTEPKSPGINTPAPTNPIPFTVKSTSSPLDQIPATPERTSPSSDMPGPTDPICFPADSTPSPVDHISATLEPISPSTDTPASTDPTPFPIDSTSTPVDQPPATPKPTTHTPTIPAPAHASPIFLDVTSSPAGPTPTFVDPTPAPSEYNPVAPKTGTPSTYTPEPLHPTPVPKDGLPSPVDSTPRSDTSASTTPTLGPEHATSAPTDSTTATTTPTPMEQTPAPSKTASPSPKTPAFIDPTPATIDATFAPSHSTSSAPDTVSTRSPTTLIPVSSSSDTPSPTSLRTTSSPTNLSSTTAGPSNVPESTTPSPATETSSATPNPAGEPNPATSAPAGVVPTTHTTEDGRLIVEARELCCMEIASQSASVSEDGCGVSGCSEKNTRDGSLDADSRWSCKYDAADEDYQTFVDSPCQVAYILGANVDLYTVGVAFYQGISGNYSLTILVDGDTVVEDWISSGTAQGFETVSLVGVSGESITIIVNLEDGEFVDIAEVEVYIIVDDVPLLGVSASERIDPTVWASSQDGVAVLDGDTRSNSSWACSFPGSDACSIVVDLQEPESVIQVSMAFVDDGDISDNVFDVSVGFSPDGPFTTVRSDTPSNKDRSETLQQFKIDSLASYIKIEASSTGSGSLHISEIDVRISEDVPIHATSVNESLVKIGLLPQADGYGDDRSEAEGGCGTKGCISFNTKDGDLETFWRCYQGGPNTERSEPTTYFQCELRFNLAYFRNLKQIRIALFDGARLASNMAFKASRPDYNSAKIIASSVISSGTTTGFETYDFDHFTKHVSISGLFLNIGESISISEVEFLEEAYEDSVVPVAHFDFPHNEGEEQSSEGFAWGSSSISDGATLAFTLSAYATITAVELKFPVGDSYKFDVIVYDVTDTATTFEGLRSEQSEEGFQFFSLDLPDGAVAQEVDIAMNGTFGGDRSFYLLDARIMGTMVDNPTDVYTVGSTAIEIWREARYPDFVTEGTGDQKSITEAICEVKKAVFDGVNCQGGDANATGTVLIPTGEYYLDGNVFMKSGVHLLGSFSEDSPYTTDLRLEDGAAGKTNVSALVVFDGVSNAEMEDIRIYGQYTPDDIAVSGLGSACLEINNSENVSVGYFEAHYCSGNAVVVAASKRIELDAGDFDDEHAPSSISDNRGIGVLVDTCDSVYIRRHAIYNNGVAGLHITGSLNVTFEATDGEGENDSSLGEGSVGSLDGQQPIDVIIDSSTLVTFNNTRFTSSNEPAIIVSGDHSGVLFSNCSFNEVESSVCVIQAEDPFVVTATDDELILDGDCFLKV